MKNQERVKIGEDRSLAIFIDGNEFTFSDRDYLKSDRGKILLKHGSVMRLAELNHVVVEEPVLLSSHNPLIYVFKRTAVFGGKRFSAVGETNKMTLFDDIMKANPATTADNRAYERAVLSVLGVYGDLYGASEINYKDKGGNEPPSVSKATAKEKEDQTQKIEVTDKTSEEKESSDTGSRLPVWWEDVGFGDYKESELDPETFIVQLGPSAGKNWTVKQLYDYNYKGCLYFAERSALDKAKDDLRKQVFACRRAIKKYGLK